MVLVVNLIVNIVVNLIVKLIVNLIVNLVVNLIVILVVNALSCKRLLCHLNQGTGWYLASWSCLCSAVLRHPPLPCLSTALHRHDQLAEYHPVPWLR